MGGIICGASTLSLYKINDKGELELEAHNIEEKDRENIYDLYNKQQNQAARKFVASKKNQTEKRN